MIKKAVLPVAGLGTRFLPASKSIPKEMVTVVDRPAIEYVVREAVEAGIEQIILVTHSSKASIENYFDRNFELETILTDLSRMISRYDESNAAQIMVEAVPDHLVDQYGIVDVAQSPNEGESIAMQGIVEKPAVGSAPSNLSVVGRYVLPARIMQVLENTPKGAGNEIQLTDAIAMLQQTDVVEAYRMQGQTFDCGSKLGYLKAVLHYGVEHPKLGNDFKQLIQELKL